MASALLSIYRMPKANFFFVFLGLFLLPVLNIGQASERNIIVSVPEQRLVVFDNGLRVAQYPISTSKFGLGDRPRSYATPLGTLQIASKIGHGVPAGTVFKGCRPTGEVLRPNSPGRDPIVTRILRLRGLESSNSRAYARGIYIHGTPVERAIGRRASYGCIRMKSRDVVEVFQTVPVGTRVEIINAPLSRALREVAATRRNGLGAS